MQRYGAAKTCLSTAVFMLLFGAGRFAAFAAQDAPAVEYVVSLPDAMQKALREYDPNFEIWKQGDFIPSLLEDYDFTLRKTPAAVIGDFNGDKILDAALFGHNRQNDLLLCILSNEAGFKVLEVEKSPRTNVETEWTDIGKGKEYGLIKYLTRKEPGGGTSSPFEKAPLELKTDAFEVNYFEKASSLYYLDGEAFASYATSD